MLTAMQMKIMTVVMIVAAIYEMARFFRSRWIRRKNRRLQPATHCISAQGQRDIFELQLDDALRMLCERLDSVNGRAMFYLHNHFCLFESNLNRAGYDPERIASEFEFVAHSRGYRCIIGDDPINPTVTLVALEDDPTLLPIAVGS